MEKLKPRAAPGTPSPSRSTAALAPSTPRTPRRAKQPERISAENLPLRSAQPLPPPQTPLPSTGIAGLELRETPPEGALDALHAEVSVSDAPVHAEMKATFAEKARLER